MESAAQQTPLEIVTSDCELNVENLEKILKHRDVADKPVAIISVAGVTRMGKSFLLNILMLYIKNHKHLNKLGNAEDQIHSYFPYKSGNVAHTSGIWMWPQPFNIEGIEIPILLMDTQGIFGSNSDLDTSAKVFALSLLTSSIQIYNVRSILEENSLEILDTFTEYGRAALQHCYHGKRPFQHLMFLFRDWHFIEQQEYGAAGGEELLKEYLEINNKQKPTLQRVRKNISMCFEKTSGFLLPFCGDKVASGVFSKISDFDVKFLEHLTNFVVELFKPNNIKAKEINGSIMVGSDICDYFITYHTTFTQEKVPSPVSMVEATTKASNLLAVSKAMKIYKLCMTEDSDSLEGKRLLRKHDQALRLSLKEFIKLPKYGEIEKTGEYMENLLDQMWFFYDGIDKKSKEFLEKMKFKYESAIKTAFLHYKSHMNEKFGELSNDATCIVDFNKFTEEDEKFNKEAMKLFSVNEEAEFKELEFVYQIQLKEKIATHYKELNTIMKQRYENIQKDHEEKFESIKRFYKKKMEDILRVDDIVEFKNDVSLNENHKQFRDEAIKKFMKDIEIKVSKITEEYKKRIEEFTDLDLERIKLAIAQKFEQADKVCKNELDDTIKWYIEKMKQFESLHDVREKHPEIFHDAKNMFLKKVEEISCTYKKFSEIYLPILNDEITSIHDRHLSRGFISETFTNPYENLIKIIVIGDKDVGKTNLVSRFTKNHFFTKKDTKELIFETTPDIGARITTVRNKRLYRILRWWDSKSVKIAIWDMSNVNDPKNLKREFFLNADGVIIVCDVTRGQTMLHNLDDWVEKINELNSKCYKYLIANKIDREREVSTKDIENFAEKYSIPFKEVSAMDNINVDEAFHDFASSLLTHKKLCVIL